MDARKLVFWCVAVFTVALEIYGRTLPQHLFITENLITVYSHFFWGLAIALGLVAYARWSALDALLTTLIIAVWYELPSAFTDKPFFYDGLFRVVLAVLGALLAWGIVMVTRGETQPSRLHSWLLLYGAALVPMLILGALITAVQLHSADIFMAVWTIGFLPLTVWFVRR